MERTIKLPFYARLALVLICITVLGGLLFVGKHVLMPLLLSLLFAILLRPVVVFFSKKLKFPHVIAVLVAVVLFILFFAAIVTFVSWQIGDIASDIEKIKSNINVHYHNIQKWVKESFNISYNQQDKYIKKVTTESLNSQTSAVGSKLGVFTDALLNLILIPIYTFLFLLYRNLFIEFLTKIFKGNNRAILFDVLLNVKMAIQSFLLGLMTEMGIVATLTSVGYMIAGVQYAVLLGVITGVLNLIPYLGITIAGCLSILATLTSSTDFSLVAGVLIVNVIVQFLDNNILVPMVVSSKVKLNAMVSILGIITGGALAGVAGMFIAIPYIAICKVIFDRIPALEPWGFLMSDDLPKSKKKGKIKLPELDKGDTK